MKIIEKEALTFDDVLLLPAESSVLPNQVELKTKLSRNISLNIPLLSSAMDTVTESSMAIAMAKQGGIGIIHKNMSIIEQGREVQKVKRYSYGKIINPITVNSNQSIKELKRIMNEYKISGVPVIEKEKLVGIITKKDLRFENDDDKLIKEVMTTENLIVAFENTNNQEAIKIMKSNKIEKLPIVDSNKKLIGLFILKDLEKYDHYPNIIQDKNGSLLVGAAVGVTDDVLDRVNELVFKGVDIITLDTSHGHSHGVAKKIKEIKAQFPNLELIGGNVATADGAKFLIEVGVDAVKVGMGPGSICTSRIIAGIGVPQITAILECSEIGKQYNIPIIADGGIKYSGDITKAIACGASTCMMGSLFAGCDESPGEIELFEGKQYKSYRGMGSISAMEKGSKDKYFQTGSKKLVPEGIEGRVAYKGSVEDTIFQLMGGLRSGMGYCGTPTINDLQVKGQFVKITNSGLKENHPHDVKITKESPNYCSKN